MAQTPMKSFLDQFAHSKQRMKDWPDWMQDSAKFAVAAFPKPSSSDNQLPKKAQASVKKSK